MLRTSPKNIAILIGLILIAWGVFRAVSGLRNWQETKALTRTPKTSQALLAPVIADPIAAPLVADTSRFLLGGVQMNEPDQDVWIRSLIESGMNTVEVTTYAHQGRWSDNNLWFPRVIDEQGLIEEVRVAKAYGMRVVLILRLQLNHGFEENDFLWHGLIFPKSEFLLHLWFQEYRRYMKQWATFAQENGVDVLVLGSEMNALFATRFVDQLPQLHEYYLNPKKRNRYKEKVIRHGTDLSADQFPVETQKHFTTLPGYLDREIDAQRAWAATCAFSDSTDSVLEVNKRRATLNYYWERLIDEARYYYKGKLTIAANFDNYHEVKFWHKLDYIGINAYFPLRKLRDGKPSPEKFRRKWERILDDIEKFREEMEITDVPVLFTELGYTEYTGSTLTPWQGSGFSLLEELERDSLIIWKKQPQDFSERTMAVQALREAVKQKKFPLAGILYWKLTTDPEKLQYDPFAIHIGKQSTDRIQDELGRFLISDF
ncbi:MAG: hypothetical protein AAGN35_19540 [Bacteroidota bacterium]